MSVGRQANFTLGRTIWRQKGCQKTSGSLVSISVVSLTLWAVPCLAVLTKGLDDPHILMRDAFAASGADHPQEHGLLQNLSLRGMA
jgi:hypothetical protein